MLPAPSLVTRKYMCQDTGRYLAFTVAALSGNSTRFPVGLHGRITLRSGHTAPASVLKHITNQAVWSNCCESLQTGSLARMWPAIRKHGHVSLQILLNPVYHAMAR